MARSSLWLWALLAAALVATPLVRVPLIVNARAHLDSDLAVDGLTLREALRGHWRWHYPGTPHIGTASLALMLPIGLIFGGTPFALAISGVVLWMLVVISTFVLALRVFGPRVAAWSLIPLTFSSTGMIWLSGRITGGHLLAVAWHAVAFLLLYKLLIRGGVLRAAMLGLWCGLGIWNDSMGVMTLVGLVPAGVVLVGSAMRASSGQAGGEEARMADPARAGIWRSLLSLVLAFLVGLMPKFVGRWADPYDAYNEQFAPIWKADVLLDHARILALDCLPRLIAGHRLPHFEAEPGGIGPDGRAMSGSGTMSLATVSAVALGLGLFLLAVPGLAFEGRREPDPGRARWAVRWGLLISSLAVLAGFVANRNIYNSDNYRYLVLLLVPWAIGFGRLMDGLSRRGQGGAIAVAAIVVGFAVAFTFDAASWYRRLGWIDDRTRPIARADDDPILGWLLGSPGVTGLGGDYWDVYRLAFLSDGRFRAVPSSRYPDRFPEWSRGLPSGHPSHVVTRRTAIGAEVLGRALRDGGAILYRGRGGTIASWPASGR
ncbi:MAG TPA: hypothetical protein VGH33_23490 [Isosphaeraceae bacterium]